MKYAFPIGTPDTKGKMLAYQGEPSKIMTDLRTIGYTGLELFVCNPKEMDIGYFTKQVEKKGFDIAAIGTGPVVSEDKLTFTDKIQERRKAAIQRAKEIVDFATIFNTQVNVGKLRGNIHKDQEKESWTWLKEAFEELCEYGQKRGVIITIEPQNRNVINNLNTTQEAAQWIKSNSISNLFIMQDIYHMNIEDKSIVASLIEAKDSTIHIHFADSNRGVPGSGHIDFIEILRVLKALKYDRYISVEVNQSPDSLTVAQKSWNFLDFISKEVV